MVGVPGRSKGCHTCKKRRVKCDEEKPTCFRCRRGGFECLGYARAVEFKNISVPAKDITAVSKLESAQSTGIFWVEGRTANRNAPRREPSLKAFESTFCVARLLDNFVWSSFGNGWIREAASGKLGSLPLEALTALSQTNFGRQERAATLRLKGATQYGKTLHDMVGRFSKNGSAGAEDLVVPIVLLVMHSIYYPYRQWEALMSCEAADEEDKWGTAIEADHAAALSHLTGLARTVQVCGPEKFQTTVKQRAFDSARMLLIIHALYNRKRSFLEEDRWQTTPWALGPAAKLPQSKLLDFLAQIPGLLEDYTAIQTAERTAELLDPDDPMDPDLIFIAGLRSAMFDHVARHLQSLFEWRWAWERQYGAGVKFEAAAKVLDATPDYLEHQCLRFDFDSNADVRASDITLYNAIHLWFLALLWKLEPSGPATPTTIADCAASAEAAAAAAAEANSKPPTSAAPFDCLAAPGESTGLRSPATEILRVYEWQARHHHLTATNTEPAYLYMFPVGMAMGLLDGEPQVGEWIAAMAGTSAHTVAYTVGRFARNGFVRFVTPAMVDPELAFDGGF